MILPLQSGADHFLEGRIGTEDFVCDPFVTYQNDLLLACSAATGGLLTLWPGPDFSGLLDCES